MNDSGRESVAILLGLHNGQAHIAGQLDSIAAQDHQDWTLTVSDDGSADGGPALVAAFADRYEPGRVRLTQGPCAGFSRNFLSMIMAPQTRRSAFVALCDQDDIWLAERLSRGVAALASLGDGPALYCARTHVCDMQMRPVKVSPLWTRPFTLRNALVQNVAAGNTIMMNRAMADLACAAAPAASSAGIAAHDWWLYQLATATGARVIQDHTAVLLYRQHGGNTMGRNDTLAARLNRLRQLLDGTFARWISAHVAALRLCSPLLTAEARALLDRSEAVRKGGLISRLLALRDLGLYRQTSAGNLALKVAVALKKL